MKLPENNIKQHKFTEELAKQLGYTSINFGSDEDRLSCAHINITGIYIDVSIIKKAVKNNPEYVVYQSSDIVAVRWCEEIRQGIISGRPQ